MGANLQTAALDAKVQTASAVREEFARMQQSCAEYARSEGLDAGYTGMWDSCIGIRVEERVFGTFDEAAEYISNTINSGALAVRVCTIKQSKAMVLARMLLNDHANETWRLTEGTPEYKAAQRKSKTLRKRLDSATATALKRSNTTHYVIAGWCKE